MGWRWGSLPKDIGLHEVFILGLPYRNRKYRWLWPPILIGCGLHTLSAVLCRPLITLSSVLGGGTLRTCVLRPPGIYGPEEQRHLPRVVVSPPSFPGTRGRRSQADMACTLSGPSQLPVIASVFRQCSQATLMPTSPQSLRPTRVKAFSVPARPQFKSGRKKAMTPERLSCGCPEGRTVHLRLPVKVSHARKL